MAFPRPPGTSGVTYTSRPLLKRRPKKYKNGIKRSLILFSKEIFVTVHELKS